MERFEATGERIREKGLGSGSRVFYGSIRIGEIGYGWVEEGWLGTSSIKR